MRFTRRRKSGEETLAQRGGLDIVDDDGEVLHEAPADVTASLRYLLARIQRRDVAGLPGRLAIVSSLGGEGVTYISRTLATVIAHDLSRSVCVVGLNWWSNRRDAGGHPRPVPAGQEEGDQEDRPPLGMADSILDQVPIDDVLVPTTNPFLWLLPAGDATLALRPVLAEDSRLDDAIDELADRFDHVLLELPPVLVTSESLIMTRLCDAFVLVVHQGVTTEQQVKRSLDELSSSISLGVVLNRDSTRIPARVSEFLPD